MTPATLWSMANDNKLLFLFVFLLGNDLLVDLLIKNGANVNLPDNQGRKPVHYAAYLGSIRI